MSSDQTTDIQSYEDQLLNAMLNSDVSQLDKLLSPNLIFTNHLDHVMTKEDDLEAHRAGVLEIENIELSGQTIQLKGGIAIVTVQAHIDGSFAGARSSNLFRFTRVWEKVIVGHSCLVM